MKPLHDALRRVLQLQLRRPFTLLAIALASLAFTGFFAAKLKLRTNFSEVLPRGKQSVRVSEQVNARLPTASTLTVVAQSNDTEALKRFVDALSPEIRALGTDLVGNVDDGTRASLAFFRKHKFLYAPLQDIEEVHGEIRERFEYEVQKRAGLGLDLDEDDAPKAISKDIILDRVKKREAELAKLTPNQRDGYYLESEGKLVAVLVRTPIASGEADRARDFREKIEAVVAKVDPKKYAADMAVDYTGDLVTSAQEVAQITKDLMHVGVAGVSMILAVVFFFYLRLRTLLATTLTVAIGVVWTFGLTYALIGSLNASTGFLVSIVVGNGINFGIVFMSRYVEARRTEPLDQAITTAHEDTLKATLAAMAAAMVAYGSLAVTDFRGFKHFGVIGGTGMVLCWVATYLFMPPLLVAFERVTPVKPDGPRMARLRGLYGRPFAWAVMKAPRGITIGGIAVGLVCIAVSIRWVMSNPMEYDMRNVQSDPAKLETVQRQLGRRVGKIVGQGGQDQIAIATDRLDQVLPLKAELEKKRDAASPERKPFERVVTIFDLVPTDQEKKIALLKDARDKIDRAHAKGFFNDQEWRELEPELPSRDIAPIGIRDLPEQVARSFTEKDGTRGRLVYIVPVPTRGTWDAHYLIDWADAFRSTTLPDKSVVEGSGRAVIFADMILVVLEDAPKAVLVSMIGTCAVILLAFRFRRAGWGVIAVLAIGVAAMLTAMAFYKSRFPWSSGGGGFELVGMKLNFLNFVAIPITIGVGADYALNLMHRLEIVGPSGIERATVETGGALVLCSLTTMLGYFALTLSVNRATESFGFAAAAGEVACILAAVLVLPAFLEWKRLRYADGAKSPPSSQRKPPA